MAVQWFTKKWICSNGIEERTKYPVRTDSPSEYKARRTAERVSRKSDTAARQMARLLNENFREGRDLHVTLEYDDRELARVEKRAAGILAAGKAATMEDALFIAAQVNGSNFIRRLQRELQKEGAAGALRYVMTTSDRDGDSGEAARLHHHFIVAGVDAETIRKKWRGGIRTDSLFTVHGDFSALAEYLAKQVRPVAGTKTYCPSRNLRQPKCTKAMPVTRFGDSEMRVPRGCVELYRSPYTRGSSQYLRYYRPPGDGPGSGTEGRE